MEIIYEDDLLMDVRPDTGGVWALTELIEGLQPFMDETIEVEIHSVGWDTRVTVYVIDEEERAT
jgi:hypothetical protein